jgi:hypothetical protein
VLALQSAGERCSRCCDLSNSSWLARRATCHVVSQNHREVEGSEWAGELLSAEDKVSEGSKLFVKKIWAEPRGGLCLWAVLGCIKLQVIIPQAANYNE